MAIAKQVIDVNIEEELKESWLLYSMSVIAGRAFPDVRDGLKPVQRRILMAMYDLNLGPTAQHRKSAKVAGDTSGNYHPHGEQVIYPTIVRMAQDFNSRYPLIQGQGNMGSIDGDPPAAMRYTEVRMSPYAMEMLADIDRDTVDFVPNYDMTRQEPVVLPGRFPNLLANGAQGIGVVFATNIPPHNLSELCDAIILLIDKPNATIDEILSVLPGPDFPTAGLILGTRGIRQAYETGRGSIVMQGKATIEPGEGGKNTIVITELPYQVNKARLIEIIAEHVKAGKLQGVIGIPDYSDRNGIRVEVELRRDVQPKKVLNYLYKHTPLRTTFNVNMLALVNGEPKVLSIKDAIKHYIEHRREVVTRRTRYDLEQARSRGHILEGLRTALDFIDEVISIIRSSPSAEAARSRLMERFDLSFIQANAILEMQLRRLVNLERQKLDDEYREVLKTIAYLEDILSDPRRVLSIIKQETRQMKERLGDARRTRIVPIEAEEIGEEDVIPEETTVVTITRDGYIKRMPIDTYRVQGRGGRGIISGRQKADDSAAQLFVATTHHYILFFTDQGRVYRLRAYEIPQASRTAMGTAIVNLIDIQPGESITASVPVQDLDGDGFLLMVTQNGEIKRTPAAEFRNIRSAGIRAFDLEEGDTLRWVQLTTGEDEVVIVTRNGMSIRFPEAEVPARSRGAGGVKAISLENGDCVVGMDLCRNGDDLLVVSEKAYGKRTSFSEYRAQSRGGKGILTMRVTEKTGRLVGCLAVKDTDRIMLMTANGVCIQLPVDSIRQSGRSTQGVILQSLAEGDTVVSIERVREEQNGD